MDDEPAGVMGRGGVLNGCRRGPPGAGSAAEKSDHRHSVPAELTCARLGLVATVTGTVRVRGSFENTRWQECW